MNLWLFSNVQDKKASRNDTSERYRECSEKTDEFSLNITEGYNSRSELDDTKAFRLS